MPDSDKVKVTFYVQREKRKKLQELFPHGIRQLIFENLTDDILEMLEKLPEVDQRRRASTLLANRRIKTEFRSVD